MPAPSHTITPQHWDNGQLWVKEWRDQLSRQREMRKKDNEVNCVQEWPNKVETRLPHNTTDKEPFLVRVERSAFETVRNEEKIMKWILSRSDRTGNRNKITSHYRQGTFFLVKEWRHEVQRYYEMSERWRGELYMGVTEQEIEIRSPYNSIDRVQLLVKEQRHQV